MLISIIEISRFRIYAICHIRLIHFEFTGTYLPPSNEVCEGYVFTGVCLSTEGILSLCPGGSPSWRGFPSWGVSVWGVSVQGGLCPGGVSAMETPCNGNEWAVRILLECILVYIIMGIYMYMC